MPKSRDRHGSDLLVGRHPRGSSTPTPGYTGSGKLAAGEPGYFQFDDIIEGLPELYHAMAITTVGLVERLLAAFDLGGSTVADICAGTGRAALTMAGAVRRVYAVELQAGPCRYALGQIARLGLENVTYIRGDARALPLRSNSVDHAVDMWGVVDRREAERVVRPGGRVFLGGCAPGNMVGELSSMVASLYGISRDSPVAGLFFSDAPGPERGIDADGYAWEDFDYVTDYGKPEEAARLYGRIYGPEVGEYVRDRRQAAVRTRLRLLSHQVAG